MLTRELRRIATAATFLTRLPLVARYASGDPQELARSVRWFPLVGAGVACLGAAVLQLALGFLPIGIAAALALAAMVAVTGAFHEDGFVDAADGLFGGMTPARRLEIMKDSRIGTFGGAALMLMLLLRWQALIALPLAHLLSALVAAHALGRAATPILALCLPYVREGASNKPVAEGVRGGDLAIALLVASALGAPLLIALGPGGSLTLALVSALVLAALGTLYWRKISGITGDCLGAATQTLEIVILLVAIAWLG